MSDTDLSMLFEEVERLARALEEESEVGKSNTKISILVEYRSQREQELGDGGARDPYEVWARGAPVSSAVGATPLMALLELKANIEKIFADKIAYEQKRIEQASERMSLMKKALKKGQP